MFKIFECEKEKLWREVCFIIIFLQKNNNKTHLSPKPLFFSGLKTDLYFENRNMTLSS